ncbi:helix-turn-helix transcriptional regulator [Xylanibacillus composti]|nr:response regulator transcription factor [Xylanibacillus composti]
MRGHKKVVKIIMSYASIVFGLKHIIEQFEFIERVTLSNGLEPCAVERLRPDILLLEDTIAYAHAQKLAEWKSSRVVDHIIVLYDKDKDLRVDELWKCHIVSYLPFHSNPKQLMLALEGELCGFSVMPVHMAKQVEVSQSLRSPSSMLTENEQQVLEQVAAGRTNTEIARMMHLSVRTVETHLNKIYRKLGARNRVEAVCKYIQSTAP